MTPADDAVQQLATVLSGSTVMEGVRVDLATQLSKAQEQLAEAEANRDHWKELALQNANKLIAIREAMREALEADE